MGVVSNEQVVGAAQVNDSKWNDLLRKLRRDVNESDARFECVYLLDDFIATGTTLLRNESEGVWDGRLVRFWDDSRGIAETHFSSDWSLRVHHHLATHRAYSKVLQTQANAITSRGTEAWFSDVDFTYGMVLPPDLPIDEQRFGGFMDLIQRYYDPILETDHMRLGGEDGRLGFGKCALPLILEHNAPNNTVALLWAETEGGAGVHAMRPLFRRRQRHS